MADEADEINWEAENKTKNACNNRFVVNFVVIGKTRTMLWSGRISSKRRMKSWALEMSEVSGTVVTVYLILCVYTVTLTCCDSRAGVLYSIRAFGAVGWRYVLPDPRLSSKLYTILRPEILPGDKGTCLWTICPQLSHDSEAAGSRADSNVPSDTRTEL